LAEDPNQKPAHPVSLPDHCWIASLLENEEASQSYKLYASLRKHVAYERYNDPMINEAPARLPANGGRVGVFYYWQVIRVGMPCRRGNRDAFPWTSLSSTLHGMSAATLARYRRVMKRPSARLRAVHNARQFDRFERIATRFHELFAWTATAERLYDKFAVDYVISRVGGSEEGSRENESAGSEPMN